MGKGFIEETHFEAFSIRRPSIGDKETFEKREQSMAARGELMSSFKACEM